MSEVNVFVKCLTCSGTGKVMAADEIPSEIDCTTCEGLGKIVAKTMDTTDIMAELGYIHGKVTAIWNQVKPGD